MTITLFVGDNNSELASTAKEYSSDAFLIHTRNYQEFFKTPHKKNITVYSSLSDLPNSNSHAILYEIMLKADDIFYCPPKIWSDHSSQFQWHTQQKTTEYYLYDQLMQKKKVHGLDLTNYKDTFYLALVSTRPSTDKCLWIAGASIAAGDEIDKDKKFGEIISKKINIPAAYLTKQAASIEWTADQILRSDIQKDDIIIWELAIENRSPLVNNNNIKYDKNPEVLLHETRLYKAITSIYQVVNFCKKISCKLIIFPGSCSPNLKLLLTDCENYHHTLCQIGFIDYGRDNIHPGPKQHKYWADFCLNLLSVDC